MVCKAWGIGEDHEIEVEFQFMPEWRVKALSSNSFDKNACSVWRAGVYFLSAFVLFLRTS